MFVWTTLEPHSALPAPATHMPQMPLSAVCFISSSISSKGPAATPAPKPSGTLEALTTWADK